MSNRLRITALEAEVKTLIRKTGVPTFFANLRDENTSLHSRIKDTERKLDLLFDYLNVEIKNELPRQYLKKKTKKS